MNELERRRFLLTLSAGASLLVPGWVMADNSLWMPDDLPVTPQQTEGPFYPEKTIEQQLYNDTDLTRKLANHELAKGQPAIVRGVVKNQQGKPLAGAIVEVWQACATGRYNHQRDANNPSLLDNNFQFWGRAITGKEGEYAFTTIIPGKYPGRTARHIHYRVDADGYRRCSTQCYFSDFGEDNLRDGIYSRLGKIEREQVTVEFDKPSAAAKKSDADAASPNADVQPQTDVKKNQADPIVVTPWSGVFDIVLAKK